MIYTYDSDMTGAPVLSGAIGTLRTVLKACMVDGFGAGAVATLSVTAGVATATFAGAHPYRVGTVAQFGGATPAGLNGQKRILSTTTSTVTFAAPGIADGAATGTISHKVAAAGWAELFAGTLTNVLCLKPTVPEATGCVLRVDDRTTATARVRAYESMTDASTGAGPTPLDSQVNGGLYWPKSGAVDTTTARSWRLVADERGMYLAVSPRGGDRYTLLYAGDIASYKSGDAYGYLITGNQQGDQVDAVGAPDGCCGYSHRSARGGAYIMRSYTSIGQSVAAQRLGAHHNGSTADLYAGTAGYSLGTYPNGPNNGLMTGVLELYGQSLRGTLPGLLHPVQDCGNAFATDALVDGTNDLAGRRLLALRVAPPTGPVAPGTVFVDLTGPWGR